jgi:hypothetical protein
MAVRGRDAGDLGRITLMELTANINKVEILTMRSAAEQTSPSYHYVEVANKDTNILYLLGRESDPSNSCNQD